MTTLFKVFLNTLYIQIGKSDFFGLNYYTSHIVEPIILQGDEPVSKDLDMEVRKEQNPEWPRAKSIWLYSAPEGLRSILKCVCFLFCIRKF